MAFNNPVSSLILPNGAGAGEPRLFLGPDLPPPLNAYSPSGEFGVGAKYVSAFVWFAQGDDTTYVYAATVAKPTLPLTAGVVFGHVTSGGVDEIAANRPTGIILSAAPGASAGSVKVNGNDVRVESNNNVLINSLFSGVNLQALAGIQALSPLVIQAGVQASPVGNPAYIPYVPMSAGVGQPAEVHCNALFSTTNAFASVSGCGITFDLLGANDIVYVDYIGNAVSALAPTGRLEVACFIDGFQATTAAEWDVGTAGLTQMVSGRQRVRTSDVLALTGTGIGSHLWELRARTTAGVNGQYTLDTGETKLIVDPRYRP